MVESKICTICKERFMFKIDIVRHLAKKHHKEILEDWLREFKKYEKKLKRKKR